MLTSFENATQERDLATLIRREAEDRGITCTVRVREGPETEIQCAGHRTVSAPLHQFAPLSRGEWRQWVGMFLTRCLRPKVAQAA